jgi:hypothetical protein
MSGTIAICASDTGRYTLFTVSLMRLKHPPNTIPDWGISAFIPGARNSLVKRALERGAEWVLFLDDDHVWTDDHLMQLLAHDEMIVGSLYFRRQPPFAPLAFSHMDDDGTYTAIDLSKLPAEGLLKVHAVGTAGLLVRSEVFRAIEPPWFEWGKVDNWEAGEDIIFCEKARDAGFDVYVDLGSQLGHMCPSAIWPTYVDQEWAIGFSVADGTRLYVPIEKTTAGTAADSKEEVAASHG